MKSESILFVVPILVVGGIFVVSGVNPLQLLEVPDNGIQPTSVQAASPATSISSEKPRSKVIKPNLADVPLVPETSPSPVDTPPIEVAVPQEAITPAPVPAAAPKPFPEAGQVAVGAPKASVTDRFGAPSMLTTGSRDGHMVETYVYAADRGRTVTVVQIKDGTVLSVESR